MACLELACRDLNIPLPEDDNVNWYELLDTTKDEIECTQLWIIRTYRAINSDTFKLTQNLLTKSSLRDYLSS